MSWYFVMFCILNFMLMLSCFTESILLGCILQVPVPPEPINDKKYEKWDHSSTLSYKKVVFRGHKVYPKSGGYPNHQELPPVVGKGSLFFHTVVLL